MTYTAKVLDNSSFKIGKNIIVYLMTKADVTFPPSIGKYEILFEETKISLTLYLEGITDKTFKVINTISKQSSNGLLEEFVSETDNGYSIVNGVLTCDNKEKSWKLTFEESLNDINITTSNCSKYNLNFTSGQISIGDKDNTSTKVNEMLFLEQLPLMVAYNNLNQRTFDIIKKTDFTTNLLGVDMFTGLKSSITLNPFENLLEYLNSKVTKKEFKEFFGEYYKDIKGNIVIKCFYNNGYECVFRKWCYLRFMAGIFLRRKETGNVKDFIVYIVKNNILFSYYKMFKTLSIYTIILLKDVSMHTSNNYLESLELIPRTNFEIFSIVRKNVYNIDGNVVYNIVDSYKELTCKKC